MSSSFGIFDVSKIKVHAYSADLNNSGVRMHVQNITIFNRSGDLIGEISLFLDHPGVAIPVGDLERLDKSVTSE